MTFSTPSEIRLPKPGDMTMLEGVFTPGETDAIKADLEASRYGKNISRLESSVEVTNAVEDLKNRGLPGISMAVRRLGSIASGYSRVSVAGLHYEDTGLHRDRIVFEGKRDLRFVVVPESAAYLADSRFAVEMVDLFASNGAVICINNMGILRSGPFHRLKASTGMRLRAAFMK